MAAAFSLTGWATIGCWIVLAGVVFGLTCYFGPRIGAEKPPAGVRTSRAGKRAAAESEQPAGALAVAGRGRRQRAKAAWWALPARIGMVLATEVTVAVAVLLLLNRDGGFFTSVPDLVDGLAVMLE